jgi:Flp pilus assembly protein TadG
MCSFDISCKDEKSADLKYIHTVAYRGQLWNTLLYKYAIAQEQTQLYKRTKTETRWVTSWNNNTNKNNNNNNENFKFQKNLLKSKTMRVQQYCL